MNSLLLSIGIDDWQNNVEQRLPNLPWRVNYPWSAAAALLPLTPENNYTPTVRRHFALDRATGV